MAEDLKTVKPNLKKSLISSSVFSAASSNIASSISPMIPFGDVAKAIGSQPKSLEIDKIDVPKPSPFADIVAQLQVKFESLSSRVRANVKDIRSLKQSVKDLRKSKKDEKDNSLEETNQILEDIGQALALDFANRVTEKKEKLDLLRDSILKKRIEDEEQELEKGVKNTKETNKKLDKVIKPAKGIFDSILEFFALLGGAILTKTAFTWLEDPANREKLAGIFTWLTEHWKWIAGGLAIGALVLAIAPLVGLFGIIGGALSAVGSALAFIAPFALPILAIAAAAIWGSNQGLGTQENKTLQQLYSMTGGNTLTNRKILITSLENQKESIGWWDPKGKKKEIDEQIHLLKTGRMKGQENRPDIYNIAHSNDPKELKDVVNDIKKQILDYYQPLIKETPYFSKERGRLGKLARDEVAEAIRYVRASWNYIENKLPVSWEVRDGQFIPEVSFEDIPIYTPLSGGGTVIGPGGIDKVPTRLTAGEEVITKDSASLFRPLLKDINDDSGKMWLAFQEGTILQNDINQEQEKAITNLANTLVAFERQTNSLVEYENNSNGNNLLPVTFLSSSVKDNNKLLFSNFAETMFPESERVESQIGSNTINELFGHAPENNIVSVVEKEVQPLRKTRYSSGVSGVKEINQVNVRDGISIASNKQNVTASKGSTGNDIVIDSYDADNPWIVIAFQEYEIVSPVGTVI